jgi:threonine/homoserine/homoserine lactone efflux protein
MLDPARLGLFAVAALILIVTPGPAVVYIVTRSVSQGRPAGLVSTLGIALGGLFHVTAAALGFSALLRSSALAFDVVRYAGAAYLLWLGVATLLGRREQTEPDRVGAASLRRVFWEGALVNILNPKTALFFLAFLPQFADPARGSLTLQIALLGLLFVAIALCSDGAWALLGAAARCWLGRHAAYLRVHRYVAGAVYVSLGLTTALAGPNRK